MKTAIVHSAKFSTLSTMFQCNIEKVAVTGSIIYVALGQPRQCDMQIK